MKAAAFAAALGALAGCASKGLMEEGAPRGIAESFSVKTDTESAYRRAIEYVRVCHVVRPHLYGATYAASRKRIDDKSVDTLLWGKMTDDPMSPIRVFRTTEAAKILELITAEPESAQKGQVSTKVTVRVLGTDLWDQAEIAAARRSIESATPTCRSLG
jgi:hypothetical protein